MLDDPHNFEHYKTLAGVYAQNRQLNDVRISVNAVFVKLAHIVDTLSDHFSVLTSNNLS